MSIKQSQYKDFSRVLHEKAGHSPIVAQMELTFRCPLHCGHCYTDCYNNPEMTKRELSTNQILSILDKCKQAGVVWFCFTGGDPLLRKDFIEIYTYAKKLGFITSIFSSLIPLNDKILKVLIKHPPFGIETTLNAATPERYKEVTQTNFFDKQVEGIKKILKKIIPLRVKTQVTKQNVDQIDKIKKLVESFGLKLRPSTMIHARLDGNTFPCDLRLDPAEAVRINKNYGYFEEDEERKPHQKMDLKKLIGKPKSDKLFKCAAGGHAFWIKADGRMIICSIMRTPDYDLLKKKNTVKEGFYTLNQNIHSLKFMTSSRCRECKYRQICSACPARAYLEKGSLEKPIDYFCRLAEETAKNT